MAGRRGPAAARWTDVLVVLLAVESAAEAALRDDLPSAHAVSLALLAPAVAAVVLPLVARHRYPFAAPASVWLAAGALSFVDGRVVVLPFGTYLAGLLSAFLLGRQRDQGRARAGLLVVVGAAAVVVGNDPSTTPVALVFLPGLFALAWLAGTAVRSRSDQLEAAEQRVLLAERGRETATRVAVAEERARIARELHDVVAHSVSVMVLQVGAVRHRMGPAAGADRDALMDVEQVGRAALGEMRRLLGALADGAPDDGRGPQPGIDDLEALVAKVRGTGLDVGLRIEGEPVRLPGALGLSAYRIVQEGLTNVLKHAHARRAEVTVRYTADAVRLEVRDDGVGPAPGDGSRDGSRDGSGGGPGRGLVGIGERVKVYGGQLSAGAADDGGYLLSVRLPVETDRA